MINSTVKRMSALVSAAVIFAIILSLPIFCNIRTASASDVSGFSVKEAQVRKHSISGIRFVIEVNKAEIEALGLDGEPEYGAVLLPEDMLGENELTLETANVLDIKKNKWYDESETSYAVALVGSYNAETGEGEGLPESYYNRPIAARGYVKGTKNGEAVVYYTTDTLIRSLGYVAAMHLATGTEDASNELIKSIAEKTDVKVSLESKTLVSGKDKLLPEVSFGGVTVPMSISKAFDFTYSITGDALKLENGELIASNVGSAEVSVTLNVLGKTFTSEGSATVNVVDGNPAYTLTFESKGVVVETLTLKKGDSFTAPKLSGGGEYILIGWKNKETGEKITSTVFDWDNDVTLVAIWDSLWSEGF